MIKSVYLPSVKTLSSTNNSFSSPAKLRSNSNKYTKARLIFKENYEVMSERAKLLILTSVKIILLLIIVKKTTSKEIWKTLTGLFKTRNKSWLSLFLCSTSAASNCKYKSMIKKVQELMNFDAKISLHKLKLNLNYNYLLLILMQNMSPE